VRRVESEVKEEGLALVTLLKEVERVVTNASVV